MVCLLRKTYMFHSLAVSIFTLDIIPKIVTESYHTDFAAMDSIRCYFDIFQLSRLQLSYVLPFV